MSDTPRTPAKRAAKKAAPTPAEGGDLKPVLRDGFWFEPVWRYRFLMADGEVIDVQACRDDSTLRGAILEGRGKDARIAGSTRLECLGYPDMQMLVKRL